MHRRWSIPAGIIALLLAVATGWLYYSRVAKWRGLEADLRSYLQEAREGDSAPVHRRVLDPQAANRVLTMARMEPQMMDTLIASIKLTFGSRNDSRPGAVTAFFSTRSSFCNFADGFHDEFQVTAMYTQDGWRYIYSGITPC